MTTPMTPIQPGAASVSIMATPVKIDQAPVRASPRGSAIYRGQQRPLSHSRETGSRAVGAKNV
jgi:hypothetical protein